MQIHSRNYSYQRGRRLPVTHRKSRRSIYITVAGLGICLITISLISKNAFFNNGDGETSIASASEEETMKKPSEPPKRQIDTSNLQTTLDQIIKKYPYDTSVSVVDMNSGKLIQTGDTYPFIAASTTKILTALFYMDKVEAGQASLQTKIGGKTAQEQLKLAVTDSDNEAWAQLNSYLGKSDLMDYAKRQNILSYDSTKNTITSNDMAQLMANLYSRKLINEAHTTLLLSWMQNTSEERFIPSAVPEGMKLYHKAGYLPDRVHDVAVIDNGSAPFVIVIYSKSYTPSYDYIVGQKLFRQVTDHTIATFK